MEYLSFKADEAKQLGVNAAVILNYLRIIQGYSEKNEYFLQDGFYWVKISSQKLAEVMPFLSLNSIKRAVQVLQDFELIVKTTDKSSPLDRTQMLRVIKKETVDSLKLSPSTDSNWDHLPHSIINDEEINEGNKGRKRPMGALFDKRASERVKEIIDFWNAKELPKCRGTNTQINTILKKLKNWDLEDLKKAITNYCDVLISQDCFYTHKFSLVDFISRESSHLKFHPDNFLRESFIKFPSGGGTATPMRELTVDMLPDPEPEPGWDYEGMKIIEDAYYGRE